MTERKSQAVREAICEAYARGESPRAIAAQYDVRPGTVVRYARAGGAKIRGRGRPPKAVTP
jgi:hypothetical protein